ncbi:hypothetical protein [Arthrobacter sp. 35W]|nr:hypothetical protein [Arthrobacter sp. 35W]
MDANKQERVWHGSHRVAKATVWQSYLSVAIMGVIVASLFLVAILH